MELRQFVDESLRQIIDGVRSAQEHARAVGARVNPKDLSFNPGNQAYDSATGVCAQDVVFDVAVTATEGTQTRGGIGIIAGPVTLGSAGKSDAGNVLVNRIQFSVRVLFPSE